MARALRSREAALKGQPKAFPFWLRKYKWTQDMVDSVNDVPPETFDGYPEGLKRINDRKNEHPWEKRRLDNKPYFLRYRTHEMDTYGEAPQCVGLLGYIRAFENELGKGEDHTIQKWHGGKRRVMRRLLKKMKSGNFPTYWRLMQDYNLWHETRISHEGYLKLGWFQHPGPESGGKVVDFERFVDAETLYGCEETGESRFAVCKRLGKLWKPGLQVYVKHTDGLWKLATVEDVNKDTRTCVASLQATGEIIPEQNWEDMLPFDLYATSRQMPTDDPIRQEEADQMARHTFYENLKVTDPARFEQEWYKYISKEYYDGKSPTGSFRGWRQRFMHWDSHTHSPKRIRWVQGLSKYMQRRVYLGYKPRMELFTHGLRGKDEPWWVAIEKPVGH